MRYSTALLPTAISNVSAREERQCHQHRSFPVRVSRGTQPCDGEEQKTCLSGASLFCVRHRASTGVCLRSRPSGVGARGSPEGCRVTPLWARPARTKHFYRCDDIAAGVMSARWEPPPPQIRTSRGTPTVGTKGFSGILTSLRLGSRSNDRSYSGLSGSQAAELNDLNLFSVLRKTPGTFSGFPIGSSVAHSSAPSRHCHLFFTYSLRPNFRIFA